jgi:hypothetical protein
MWMPGKKGSGMPFWLASFWELSKMVFHHKNTPGPFSVNYMINWIQIFNLYYNSIILRPQFHVMVFFIKDVLNIWHQHDSQKILEVI